MFITTPDSPVYCSQHPSQGTNRQSWTKKILGEHERFTVRAHACLPLLGRPCAHCDRATPISGVQPCVHVQSHRPYEGY